MPKATVFEHIREHLLKAKGLGEHPRPSYASLAKTEWVPEFEQLMRNRLIMGGMRYGLLAEQKQSGKVRSLTKRMLKIIAAYEEKGNTELLVDLSNLAMVEFYLGYHPCKHFISHDRE